jgi:hypothetical protein
MGAAVAGTQEIDLVQSLAMGTWLKLPLNVMRSSGPAVQTFAGLLKVTHNETFVPAATIARHALLPLKTVRKHLLRLAADGWIMNAGRERMRSGVLRRTATLQLTKEGRASLFDYGVLPWWACGYIRNGRQLHWNAKAVLSIVMARLMSLNAAAQREDGLSVDSSDPWASIDHFGGQDRFRFSLSYLQRRTGLSRESVVRAKRELTGCKIIKWIGDIGDDGGFNVHVLWPNENFRVIITPAARDRVYLSSREVRGELEA